MKNEDVNLEKTSHLLPKVKYIQKQQLLLNGAENVQGQDMSFSEKNLIKKK